jgi:hypothetical protein
MQIRNYSLHRFINCIDLSTLLHKIVFTCYDQVLDGLCAFYLTAQSTEDFLCAFRPATWQNILALTNRNQAVLIYCII